MNPTTAPTTLPPALEQARAATITRLVNCVLREVGPTPRGAGTVRLEAPTGGTTLLVTVRHHSMAGQHVLDDQVLIEECGGLRPAEHDEVVAILLRIVASAAATADGTVPGAADAGRVEELAHQIADSTARSSHYLERPAPTPVDATELTRIAEQSVRLGHPFHPTPKTLELVGPLSRAAPDETVLEGGAPELGASFRLPHVAMDPGLAREALDGAGPWLPQQAQDAAPTGWPVIPVLPVQLAHLRARPQTARLLADGALIELGEQGGTVHPTSSVRTVWDPGFPTMWKLPLHVRITNFVRTIPPEHAHRAHDASRVVRALRPTWRHPGFGVLVESGWRGADPAVVGDDVAADLTVVFRENPLAGDPCGPRVLAALTEPGRRGGAPDLVAAVRRTGAPVHDWLRSYLRVSLLPLLEIFARDGVGFEAHLQNSLLSTDDDGRPVGFWVRDMEGTHVSRDRLPRGLDPTSPLVYDEAEAWQRFRYHVVVNQLAGVVAVLGRELATERSLWAVVADALGELDDPHPAAPWAHDLRSSATLPAKANFLSRFLERGEAPLFVGLPNPIREAATR